MKVDFQQIYASLIEPNEIGAIHSQYVVASVLGFESYLIGKDADNLACLLIASNNASGRKHSPINLENIEANFEIPCLIKEGKYQTDGKFTVIKCKSLDRNIVRYFLSLCETIAKVVGNKPSSDALSDAIARLVYIFQKLQKPPSRTLNGLFGELFLIWKSQNPIRALTAWRVASHSSFDFVLKDLRLDVKTTSGRRRVHTFSFEQCNPPSSTDGFVASLLVEQISGGVNQF